MNKNLMSVIELIAAGNKADASTALSAYLSKKSSQLLEGLYGDPDDLDRYDGYNEVEKTPFDEKFETHGVQVSIKGSVVRRARSHTRHYGRHSPPETTVHVGPFEGFDKLDVSINGQHAIGDGFEPTEHDFYSKNFPKMVSEYIGHMYDWHEEPEFLEKVIKPIQANPGVVIDIANALKRIYEEHGAGELD